MKMKFPTIMVSATTNSWYKSAGYHGTGWFNKTLCQIISLYTANIMQRLAGPHKWATYFSSKLPTKGDTSTLQKLSQWVSLFLEVLSF